MSLVSDLVGGLGRWDWPVLAGAVVLALMAFIYLLTPASAGSHGKRSNGGWFFGLLAMLVVVVGALWLYTWWTT